MNQQQEQQQQHQPVEQHCSYGWLGECAVPDTEEIEGLAVTLFGCIAQLLSNQRDEAVEVALRLRFHSR